MEGEYDFFAQNGWTQKREFDNGGVSDDSSYKRWKTTGSENEFVNNCSNQYDLINSIGNEEQNDDLYLPTMSEDSWFDLSKFSTSKEAITSFAYAPGAETLNFTDSSNGRTELNASFGKKPLEWYTPSPSKLNEVPTTETLHFTDSSNGRTELNASFGKKPLEWYTPSLFKLNEVPTTETLNLTDSSNGRTELNASFGTKPLEWYTGSPFKLNEVPTTETLYPMVTADVNRNVSKFSTSQDAITSLAYSPGAITLNLTDSSNGGTYLNASLGKKPLEWYTPSLFELNEVPKTETIYPMVTADVNGNVSKFSTSKEATTSFVYAPGGETLNLTDSSNARTELNASLGKKPLECYTPLPFELNEMPTETLYPMVTTDVNRNGYLEIDHDSFYEALVSDLDYKNSTLESVDECKNGSHVSSDASKNQFVNDIGESSVTQEGEEITEEMGSHLSTSSSKKLEIKNKMKVKDLLETGMLEGFSVSYMTQRNKNGLKGMISDRGIMCSCAECNWKKVITPMTFERHAGSANKRAAQYIHLENGNSIRDVINACKGATLDTLEETIAKAIGFSSGKRATICRDCKGPLPTSRAFKTAVLCNSCLKSKKPQASQAGSPGANAESIDSNVTPNLSDVAPRSLSRKTKSTKGKLTRKDLGLHKLVFEENGLPDGAEVAYYCRGQKCLNGYKKGFGILCCCCNKELSPSQFEGHAGWASRRKPYLNIFTSDGVSLHDLSISLAKHRNIPTSKTDDLCNTCEGYGNLLLCDGCPRGFHLECVNLSDVPKGKWYCIYCKPLYGTEKPKKNRVEAQRVSGDNSTEQVSNRCIRTVKTQDSEVGGCVLCRTHDFTKTGFGPSTVLLCDQCEKEYHVGCLKDHKMANLTALPKGDWFCCTDCNEIRSALQELVVRGPEKLDESLSHFIKMNGMAKFSNENGDVELTLLRGKLATPEHRALLSKVIAIFHERFNPIIDPKTGRDLIPTMVYGRNTRDQDFQGMYCAVLTVNSIVVSAGILRIFGQEVAELPLVATKTENQGQGYFQSLFSCIERLLGSLNVKKLVIPAAGEAESIWTSKFGFKKLPRDKFKEYQRDWQITTFQGTSMLEKLVPVTDILGNSAESADVGASMLENPVPVTDLFGNSAESAQDMGVSWYQTESSTAFGEYKYTG